MTNHTPRRRTRRPARKSPDPSAPLYETREALRDAQLYRDYGIGYGLVALMTYERQGRCDCCGRVPKKGGLVIDHDHKAPRGPRGVRGLLCGPCNRAIGTLGDDAAGLYQAYNYLARYEQRQADRADDGEGVSF